MEFRWHASKEETLKKNNRPSFQDAIIAIENNGLIAELENSRYPSQKILVVKILEEKHLCAVPCTIEKGVCFLHTVHPSRSLSKKFRKGKSQ